jgi:putative hydrolase of the HAD superfamily
MVRLTRQEASGVPVRAVTYDLWLTLLVDVDPAMTHAVRAGMLAELLEVSYDAAVALELKARAAMYEGWLARHALTVPDLAAVVLRAAGRDLDLLDATVDALESPTTQAGVRLLPGAREVLETLSGTGVPLGLVCDTGLSSGRHTRAVLDDLGVLDAFEVTVFSDETGVPKPSALPFQIALSALGSAPGETLHVGDIRRRDITGALGVGMQAVRFRGGRDDPDRATPDAPAVIDRHDEVLPLVSSAS